MGPRRVYFPALFMKKLFLILPMTAASLMFSACDDKKKADADFSEGKIELLKRIRGLL